MRKRLEQIEAELESLGESDGLSAHLPERYKHPGAVDTERAPDLEMWSSTIVAALVKAVWASPVEADADEQFRRSNRARELRALATPIDFEPSPPPPPRSRPEPETAKPPSWAWAATKPVS